MTRDEQVSGQPCYVIGPRAFAVAAGLVVGDPTPRKFTPWQSDRGATVRTHAKLQVARRPPQCAFSTGITGFSPLAAHVLKRGRSGHPGVLAGGLNMASRSLFGRRSRMPYSCNMLPADGQTPRNGPKPDGILLSRTEGAHAPSLVERSEYAVALTFSNKTGAPADAGGGMAQHAQSEKSQPLTGGQPQLIHDA